MAVRTTMQDLFRKVRRYIGDPAGPTQIWTDQELQDTLDGHDYRKEVRYGLLQPWPDLQPGGIFNYLVYAAPYGDWEANEVVMNSAFTPLTPAISDRNVGRWTLAVSTYPPIWLRGFRYDLNAAAVELLESRMAQLATAYDFSPPGGGTFRRSQIFDHLDILVAACYERMEPGRASMVRSDIAVANAPLDTTYGPTGISVDW